MTISEIGTSVAPSPCTSPSRQENEWPSLWKHKPFRRGVEYKRADAPQLTPSMRIALEDLKLQQTAVVYLGSKRYPLADRVHVVPLTALVDGMNGLFPRETTRTVHRKIAKIEEV